MANRRGKNRRAQLRASEHLKATQQLQDNAVAVQDCANPTAQPRWYADPWKQAPLRWWDGQRWTSHTES